MDFSKKGKIFELIKQIPPSRFVNNSVKMDIFYVLDHPLVKNQTID